MTRIAQWIKKYGSAVLAWLAAGGLMAGPPDSEALGMDPKLGAVIFAGWGLVVAISKWLAPDADAVLAVKEAKAEVRK